MLMYSKTPGNPGGFLLCVFFKQATDMSAAVTVFPGQGVVVVASKLMEHLLLDTCGKNTPGGRYVHRSATQHVAERVYCFYPLMAYQGIEGRQNVRWVQFSGCLDGVILRHVVGIFRTRCRLWPAPLLKS